MDGNGKTGAQLLGLLILVTDQLVISIRFAWLTTPDCPRVWDNDSSTENGGGM